MLFFLIKESYLNIHNFFFNQTKANLPFFVLVLGAIALQRTRPDCVWEYSSIAPLKPSRRSGPEC